jgi:uncharacterized protein (TIGR03083 family)
VGLVAPPIVDTRAYFRPVSRELVALLRELAPADWQRPTLAGSWRVRDVTSHVVDTICRRLSFHRDGLTPPPPRQPIANEQDFVAFINSLNKDWVEATERLSPRVLTDLFERVSGDLADFIEALPLDAPALFPVSWAGEQQSAGWFDVGREFTELWHHQQQIRLAVGARPLANSRYLHAVIAIAIRGLPHAYRAVQAPDGTSVTLLVDGEAGGEWTLQRQATRWTLSSGHDPAATTTVRISDDNAWRLLFNALDVATASAALREPQASAALQVTGNAELARPLLQARSVIV